MEYVEHSCWQQLKNSLDKQKTNLTIDELAWSKSEQSEPKVSHFIRFFLDSKAKSVDENTSSS